MIEKSLQRLVFLCHATSISTKVPASSHVPMLRHVPFELRVISFDKSTAGEIVNRG